MHDVKNVESFFLNNANSIFFSDKISTFTFNITIIFSFNRINSLLFNINKFRIFSNVFFA